MDSVNTHWKAVEWYLTMVLFGLKTQYAVLENFSALDLALSGVKWLRLSSH